MNQKVTEMMLQRLGYGADLAANGVAALEALGRKPYPVVLLDLQMPEMDGFETARRILGDAEGERPAIIAMTAFAQEEDQRKCRESGMDDYLSKPVRIEELRAALERAMGAGTPGDAALPEAGEGSGPA